MSVRSPISIVVFIVASVLLAGVSAVAQPQVADDTDPVVRSMRMIEASVEERAKAAEAVVAASKLVDRSAAARKQGDRDKARVALKEAEQLAAEWKAFNRSALIEELNRLVAAEQTALNPIRRQSVPLPMEGSLRISVPRSITARLNSYRDRFVQILQQEGVPTGLLGLALIESGFNPLALSPKGARGIWQFMPGTAVRYGLPVSESNDHRTHPEHSTRAAARYLRDLYQQFGDWKLAIAAYNSGENRVQRIIDKTGIRSFEEMSRRRLLPAETRNYVPAVLAAWSQLGGPSAATPSTVPEKSERQAPRNGFVIDALTRTDGTVTPSGQSQQR
jgi:soluble lytic murein transglycosylase-like protein